MKKITLLCCLLGMLIGFTGCSKSNDEPEEPKPNISLTINGEKGSIPYSVPVEGGTYIVTLKYNEEVLYPIYIMEMYEDKEAKCAWTCYAVPDDPSISTINLRDEHLVCDWYDAFFEDGKGLTMKILPNETGKKRWMEICYERRGPGNPTGLYVLFEQVSE